MSLLTTVNATAAVAALNNGSMTVAFAGSGFLAFWYLGVMQSLVGLGVITPGVTRVGGVSGGACMGLALCGRAPLNTTIAAFSAMARTCRGRASCAGSLGMALDKLIRASRLPADAYQRCAGRGYFYSSVVGTNRSLLASTASQQLLISGVEASAYVPYISGPSASMTYLGQRVTDGVANNPKPCPPGGTYCLKISCWAGPLMAPPTPPTPASRAARALAGAATALMQRLTGGTAAAPPPPPPPGSGSVAARDPGWWDLQPGRFTPCKWTQAQWDAMTFVAPSDADMAYMLELGRKDGLAWGRHAGLLAA